MIDQILGYKGTPPESFRKMAIEAGRDPASIAITVWFPRKDPDLMKRYQELGVERVVFNLDSEPAAKVLPEVDAIGALIFQDLFLGKWCVAVGTRKESDLLEIFFRQRFAVIVWRQPRRFSAEEDRGGGGVEHEHGKLEKMVGRLPEALGLPVVGAHDGEERAVALGRCSLSAEVDAAGIRSGL